MFKARQICETNNVSAGSGENFRCNEGAVGEAEGRKQVSAKERWNHPGRAEAAFTIDESKVGGTQESGRQMKNGESGKTGGSGRGGWPAH